MNNKHLPAPAATSSASDDLREVMHRRLGHALIFAVAGGAIWYFLVQPVETSYAAKLQECEGLESRIARFTNDGIPGEDMRVQAASLDKRLADILAWTSSSSDPRSMYDAITKLAAAHDVRLERIEPTAGQTIHAANGTALAPAASSPRSRRGRAAAANSSPAASWVGRTVGHRLTISGTYAQIAEFIAMCETDLGASKVVSFRFRSDAVEASRPEIIQATLELTHLSLMPPVPPKSKSTSQRSQQPGFDGATGDESKSSEAQPIEGSPR